MKNPTIGHALILSLVCLLLVAGCAKKPIAPQVTETPPPADTMDKATPADPVEQPVSDPAPVQKAEIPTIELDRIHFAFDQSTLTPEARDALAANAVVLKTSPELMVNIGGHCDSRGSDEYNLALGERRAQAAKKFLVSLGVAADRIQIISYGEEQPLDSANNETAYAKNRRAEFNKLN